MKRLFTAAGAVALVMLLHTAFFRSSWGERVEMRFLDLWFQWRGPIPAPDDVVVITMDEDSYDVLGFPLNLGWPRAAHAMLLKRLKAAGARRVVFDVLFDGPGPSAAVDDQLAAAMREVPTVIGANIINIKEAQYRMPKLDLPLEKFREAATLGLIGLPLDADRVRKFLLPNQTYDPAITGGLPSLAVAGSGTTKTAGPRDLIRFYGPPRSMQTYSFYQALETEVPLPANRLRDKIIFVGSGIRTELGPALKDSFLTSFAMAGETFGVEIHATAAANLLHDDWIRRQSEARETGVLALMAGLIAVGLLRFRPVGGAILTLAYAVGWAGLAYGAFLRGAFLPGAVLAVIVAPFTYLGATLANYLVTRLQQLRLERAFKFYLSPEMARQVAQNPQSLRLGGEEVDCTALFTDIAGFTTIAEQLKPDEVGGMLNAYFTEVMDAIFDQRGTVIQFLGDGVYALWGAPLKTSDHARLCCQAALAIHAAIEKFNQSGRFPPLRTRFGINSGPILVGNLGSARRFDFTGIGDAVNLASRVEGLNKYFGTTILITDYTRERLPADMASLKLGLIKAVGKNRAVGLHALFGEAIAPAVVAEWLEALERFLGRDWPAADELFAKVSTQEARLAKAVSLYREQIVLHRQVPPEATWQGEIIFKTK